MPVATIINLAIADDHALFAKALKHFLSEQENFRVVIQASELSDLLKKLRSVSVDVLLMVNFLPQLKGHETLNIIRNEYPALRIIFLSMSTDMDLIGHLLEAGIYGYLSKSDEPENLVDAIRAASQGRIYRNRLFTEALYRNRQNSIKAFIDGPSVPLSDREKKILQMIWEEKSNKEIADVLFIGTRSVEKIRQDMKEKIGVKSTIGLLKYAIDMQIISPLSRQANMIH